MTNETVRKLGKFELDRVTIPYEAAPSEAVAFFTAQDPADLAIMLVNDQLNTFIGGEDEGHKPLDYQGWGWRSVDFFTPGGVTIADGDGRVAVCQNNKWDYTQRDLTVDEQARFLELVWAAFVASRQGGLLSQIRAETKRLLAEANDYIKSLTIDESSN